MLHVIFFICCISTTTSAQNAKINGKVKDEHTVLQSATILIAGKEILTNDEGEFSVTVNPGTYTILITHVGYKQFDQVVILDAGETRSFEFILVRAESMGAVVVLGSRSMIQRSNLSSAVPVDKLSSTDLQNTGQQSLIQMLNFSVPSFNSSRQNLFEPVTLRGLSPDHLLIMINGTRYHNTAYINTGSVNGTLGRGSVTNTLNSIPFSAIEKIEILRDGASAQYGSDAIAGVMNVELKKTIGKTSINLLLGQYYKGDGESLVFGLNRGIRLFKKGYLNFSADLRLTESTHRGGTFEGTVYNAIPSTAPQAVKDSIAAIDNAKILERGLTRKDFVSNDGIIPSKTSGFLVNGAYSINNKVELFWTGTASYRDAIWPGVYRYPKNQSQVNTALYPDGFKPLAIIYTWDITGIAGARGKTNNGWSWEWNSVLGKNINTQKSKNSNNASQAATLGASAPTEFYGGSTLFTHQINTLSFNRDIRKLISWVKTLNVSFGGEFRYERVENRKGDSAAWYNYDPSGRAVGGAPGSGGITVADAVNENRIVTGLFVDLESDISDRMLIDLAGRFENYNDFGNNVAGKLALRYKVFRGLNLRGSISNGYHAPGLQQIYFNSTGTAIRNVGGVTIPVRHGIFRNNSEVAKIFGVPNLRPEKALNLSAGFTSTFSSHINLTIDAYWIKVTHRIVLSGIFDKRTNPDVEKILENYPNIDQVQFVTNAINTETRGVDIVMNGNWKIKKANLRIMFAANFNRINLVGPIQATTKLPTDSLNTNTLLSRQERVKIENGQPESKIIFSANYSREKLSVLLQGTRFGKTTAGIDSLNVRKDEFYSAKILFDGSVSYMPSSWVTITLGSNNVFDVYPDRRKHRYNMNEGIVIYGNESLPFGYNGGSYYLKTVFNF
jgi:iron complex outermembrane receptor protein